MHVDYLIKNELSFRKMIIFGGFMGILSILLFYWFKENHDRTKNSSVDAGMTYDIFQGVEIKKYPPLAKNAPPPPVNFYSEFGGRYKMQI